ncbi:hypothetical protein C1N80_09695 [Brachybacterium sp. SGAir0954]|nr:hypothetical protein C1N80_09695 [Brachybacterium sp. SGAir0954]
MRGDHRMLEGLRPWRVAAVEQSQQQPAAGSQRPTDPGERPGQRRGVEVDQRVPGEDPAVPAVGPGHAREVVDTAEAHVDVRPASPRDLHEGRHRVDPAHLVTAVDRSVARR